MNTLFEQLDSLSEGDDKKNLIFRDLFEKTNSISNPFFFANEDNNNSKFILNPFSYSEYNKENNLYEDKSEIQNSSIFSDTDNRKKKKINENKILLNEKIYKNYNSKHIFKIDRNKIIKKINKQNNNTPSENTPINSLSKQPPPSLSNFLFINPLNSTKNHRCDTLLIKFKVIVGKTFINSINGRLRKLLKRKIKFFAFNYKKFTINVSYSKNICWLNQKMKDLLIYGEEKNQIKNKKSLKLLMNKRGNKEIEKIKEMLEISYEKFLEIFYESKSFENLVKNNKEIIEMDKTFKKIMGKSLLDKNGFIEFMYSRKGNCNHK